MKLELKPLIQEDLLLLDKLKDPDTRNEAFKELLFCYQEKLYWHIRNMAKSHQDTDDILQNTFIKIYRNIENFKGESKLYSWMYRIATNETITYLNLKAKRLQIDSLELQTHLVENLESDIYFDGKEIQLKLQKAIACLPQKQQQVFNMKYFEELKYREMAEILGTSEGALKASYHFAVKKIEKFLKDD